jgi:hypothetical protein
MRLKQAVDVIPATPAVLQCSAQAVSRRLAVAVQWIQRLAVQVAAAVVARESYRGSWQYCLTAMATQAAAVKHPMLALAAAEFHKGQTAQEEQQ